MLGEHRGEVQASGDVSVEVGGCVGAFGEFDRKGRPEDAAFAVGDLFQSGGVVEAQRFEPVLCGLREGQCDRTCSEGDSCVVIGERFDIGAESESGGAMDNLPVLIAVDGAGDKEVAASVDVTQQSLPCSFSQGLRRGQDGELRGTWLFE